MSETETAASITDTSMAPDDRRGIVVGVDGSSGSSIALRWALAHVDRFGPVRPVLVWHQPNELWLPSPVGGWAPPPATSLQASAEEALTGFLEGLEPADYDDPLVVEGHPPTVLVELADDASLLVVGSRGQGVMATQFVGSVSRACADHATSPLVIVPEVDDEVTFDGPKDIVVGVDGSDNGQAALLWAIRTAGPLDTITAHTTWHYAPGLGYDTIVVDPRGLEEESVRIVNEAVDRACADLGIDPDRVGREAECGDARGVLRRLAETADLVVVGARGRSGIAHLFLGSTTSSLVLKPRCPTAIVPAEQD